MSPSDTVGGLPSYLRGERPDTRFLNLVHRNSDGTITPHATSRRSPEEAGSPTGEGGGSLKQEWADVLSTLKFGPLDPGAVLVSPPSLPTFSVDGNDTPGDYFDTRCHSATPETDISRTSSTSTKGSLGSAQNSDGQNELGSSAGEHNELHGTLGAPIELVSPSGEMVSESDTDTLDNENARSTPSAAQMEPASLDVALSRLPSAKTDAPAAEGTDTPTAQSIPPHRLAHIRVRRMHSLLELAETEKNYVGDLEMLMSVFFAQLHTVPFFGDNDKRTDTVIRNTKEILEVHQQFALRLDQMVSNAGIGRTDVPEIERAESRGAADAVSELAQILVEFAPKLEVYTDFCSRHKEALALIEAAESRVAEWDAFQQRCAELAQAREHDRRPHVKRLLFRDFLIKPVQRICLYPVVLDMLLRNAKDVEGTQLHDSINAMRGVVGIVDEASRKRDVMLHSEAIASRIEVPSSFPPNFLASLGNCLMAGNVDVLHHHPTLAPLSMPLPFKYYGCLLYEGFVLMVKVRKSNTYSCRHWFPLAESQVSRTDAHENWIQNGFRISIRGHHIELIASNPKEYRLWFSTFSAAHARSKASGPRGLPCSFTTSDVDTNETQGGANDPLNSFLAVHTAELPRGRSAQSTPAEILLRHKSPPRRAAMDRGMLFSDACISARALPTNEGIWPKSAIVAQSPGGAMRHIRRLSGTETLSLRVPRNLSMTSASELDLPSLVGEMEKLPSSAASTRPESPTDMRQSTDGRYQKESFGAGARLRRKVRDAYLRSRVSALDTTELEGAVDSLRLKRGPRTSFDYGSSEEAEIELLRRKSSESLDAGRRTPLRGNTRSMSLFAPARNWLAPNGPVYEDESLSSSQTSLPGSTTRRNSQDKGAGVGPSLLKRSESLSWLTRPRDSLRKISVRHEDTQAGMASTSASMIASSGAPLAAGSTDAPGNHLSSRASTSQLVADTSDSLDSPSRSLSPQRRITRRFFQQHRLSPVTRDGNSPARGEE